MEIPAEFFKVSFNKAMAFGYKTDDVDEFVTKALELTRHLQEENNILQQKLEVLATNLEGYREEEDSLRSALIGAQKLGDSILKDSRQKAELMINEASQRAAKREKEASQRAEKREKEAEEQCDRQRYELDKLQQETVAFKEKLFALYRTHLDIIKGIPSEYDKVQRTNAPPTAVQQPHQRQEEQPTESPREPQEEQPVENIREQRQEEQPADYTREPQEEQPADYTHEQHPAAEQLLVADPLPAEREDFAGDYPESPREDSPGTSREALFNMNPSPEPRPGSYPNSTHEREERSTPSRRGNEALKGFSGVASPFSASPMVQLEFESDDFDDDDFAAEKLLLREANQNRTPYLDDDEFEVPLAGKKKLVVSEKFGELKFGEAFNLRDD